MAALNDLLNKTVSLEAWADSLDILPTVMFATATASMVAYVGLPLTDDWLQLGFADLFELAPVLLACWVVLTGIYWMARTRPARAWDILCDVLCGLYALPAVLALTALVAVVILAFSILINVLKGAPQSVQAK